MNQYMGELILSPDGLTGKHITVSHDSAYTPRLQTILGQCVC